MNRFKNILYVHEPGANQDSAMGRAVSLAKHNSAALTVIDVMPPVGSDLSAAAQAQRRQALESFLEPHRQRLPIRFDEAQGPVFLEVIRAVLRNSYDLVVKAAENPDFIDKLFGSTDMHLLRKCPCPLWLMKLPEKPRYRCVLAAVDFEPAKPDPVEHSLNREILELSSSLALADGASLHLVHAWESSAEDRMRRWGDNSPAEIAAYVEKERALHHRGLDEMAEKLGRLAGSDAYARLSPSLHLVKGPAKRMIPVAAARVKADILVMGTVARTGISGFIIGNTAEAVFDQLQCSVLAVKPEGFETPVKLDA